MSKVACGMATPFKEDLKYEFPDDDDENKYKGKKYKIVKFLELVLTSIATILFIIGISAIGCSVKDAILCVAYGFFLIYPILFYVFNIKFDKFATEILVINALISLTVILTGGCIFAKWMKLEENNDGEDEEYSFIKTSNYTEILFSSLLSFLNGAVYLGETFIMTLEHNYYV